MPNNVAADQLFAAFHGNMQVPPLTETRPDLTLDEGYRIASDIHARRVARGERPVGRKIGFTNRTIWPIYNVDAPVWGWMYDHAVQDIPSDGVVTLPVLPEPRIEPEIVFGFKASPSPDMDDAALVDCIDWVAHGIEIVVSLYPGWKFTAPDSVAALAMHGALWIGTRQTPTPERLAALATSAITLTGPDETHRGSGSDVLDGPLSALRYLLGQIGRMPNATSIQAGEVVTTGTLTDARPIAAGQTWRTEFDTPLLQGLTVHFR
ncbi:2-keto-4-pentenoate hydratase [Marivita hallyeonensis]|uniref:2-oxo-3-hexenedioate decarboxylase n=1 Tax=Marivita hallyeonensis TaxID=996342 RepID=A0A1M5NTN9_9RHOB|nr:hydratase [Marivita hallyeonensis]SHG92828.1 2-oxo-3-hexenedioate decarboxylase [Marivita hallyeonensis]